MKERILKHINGKKVLFFFAFSNLTLAFMILFTVPIVKSYAGGMELLDTMPTGYNLDYVNQLFNELGVKGREAYLFYQLPVDMLYPLLFAISNCLLFAFFIKKLNKVDSLFFQISYLPIIAGLADYFENFGIIQMLLKYPELSSINVHIVSSISIIKSLTTTVFFVSLLIVLLILAKNWISKTLVAK